MLISNRWFHGVFYSNFFTDIVHPLNYIAFGLTQTHQVR